MNRVLDIDGRKWTVVALPEEAKHRGEDSWHHHRVRFEPVDDPEIAARQAWLRQEEDVPSRDVLDQYRDEELVEVFLVAEEVRTDAR